MIFFANFALVALSRLKSPKVALSNGDLRSQSRPYPQKNNKTIKHCFFVTLHFIPVYKNYISTFFILEF